MSSIDNAALRRLMGGPQVVPVAVPTEAQRRELERVQAMQVRTNAAIMATQLLAGQAPAAETWRYWADVITGYITGPTE